VATKPKFISLDAVIALEGLSRKQLVRLQQSQALKFYEIEGSIVVEECELHAALDRAKREVRL
jgi:hypothetical protein